MSQKRRTSTTSTMGGGKRKRPRTIQPKLDFKAQKREEVQPSVKPAEAAQKISRSCFSERTTQKTESSVSHINEVHIEATAWLKSSTPKSGENSDKFVQFVDVSRCLCCVFA